jgi:D-arabinose 1-dehydrogenase-like Zn-dependent alcohol dehydrogenase
MDAVATPWAALLGRGGLMRGESVLIVGAGGLGLNAVQIGCAIGAAVAVVDVDEAKIELAREFGAQLGVTPAQVDEVVDWSSGGVDLALEASGAVDGLRSAARAVHPGGRVVCCGYRAGQSLGIDSPTLVLGELTLLGSRSATVEQARAALDAVEHGTVRPFIDRRVPLDEVNSALDLLGGGGVRGRIIVEPSG